MSLITFRTQSQKIDNLAITIFLASLHEARTIVGGKVLEITRFRNWLHFTSMGSKKFLSYSVAMSLALSWAR
jgi:hypothetical protein